MRRVTDWLSWSLASFSVALLALGILLTPHSTVLAQYGGPQLGACNGDNGPFFCNDLVTPMSAQCYYSGSCTDNGTNCGQVINPTECSDCHCTDIMSGCYCK